MNKTIDGKFAPIDYNDIVGKRYNKLIILSMDKKRKRRFYYKCKCDCGNICIKERSAIMNNICNMCYNCYEKEKLDKLASSELNKKFGKLLVLEVYQIVQIKTKEGKNKNIIKYKCKCDCGNICIINKNNLLYSKTLSCGCLKAETARKNNSIHNMSKTKFYKAWDGMKQRCYNSNNDSYLRYGARGIIVCERWLGKDGFINFKNDMYESYLEHVEKFGESNTSIDRIDNDGNYEPDNCRWATIDVQNNNMSTNTYVFMNNKRYTCAELYREIHPNISEYKFRYIINNMKSNIITDTSIFFNSQDRKNAINPLIFKDKDGNIIPDQYNKRNPY